MSVKNAVLKILCIFAVLAGIGDPAIAAKTFTNPLLDSGPDPWVTYDHGYYYYTNTLGDRLQIWKTPDITQLRGAAARVVWHAPPTGANSASIWAPELHRLNGKWFLYFTAVDREHNDDAHRRQFVLENSAPDPLTGRWIERGMLATAHPGIDGTVFSDKGRLYFAYSAYVGSNSDLIIAPMTNPWTLSATQVDIAQPTFQWEKQGGRQILEGPEFLPGRRGQRLLAYSASACWSDDYSIGLLVAEPGADLLDPASWKKSPEPVFKSSTQSGVYAPGHNGFFKSPDGREDWIIYHANSGPGQRCTSQRSPRIQKFTWREDGLPDFGVPSPAGVPIEVPSGQ